MIPRPPTPTLFPYTTLFRSHPLARVQAVALAIGDVVEQVDGAGERAEYRERRHRRPRRPREERSEEHTSELQSPDHLVCRLLLEKKKNHTTSNHSENIQE